MTLVMVGGIVLDTQQSEKELLSDCSCTEQIQVQQQEARMFGWGRCKNGVQKKKFFFITVNQRGCCPTYH